MSEKNCHYAFSQSPQMPVYICFIELSLSLTVLLYIV